MTEGSGPNDFDLLVLGISIKMALGNSLLI
jgi:hypothetical protein